MPFSTTSKSYKGGVSLSVARVNADVVPDILVGAGVLGGSLVDVWAWTNSDATLRSLSLNGLGFAAYSDASRTAPVQVSTLDINDDGLADTILVSQGPGGTTSQIRAFHITNIAPLMVSPPALVSASFPGANFIATINHPSSSLYQMGEANSVVAAVDAQSTIKVSTPSDRSRNVIRPEDVNGNSLSRVDGTVTQGVYRDVKQADFTNIRSKLIAGAAFRGNKSLNKSEGLGKEWTNPSHHDAVFAELGLGVE